PGSRRRGGLAEKGFRSAVWRERETLIHVQRAGYDPLTHHRSIHMTHIVSAVFDSHAEAERAVNELRSAGVSDNALSIIARHDSGTGDYGDADTHEAKEKGEGLIKG